MKHILLSKLAVEGEKRLAEIRRIIEWIMEWFGLKGTL